MSIRSATSGDCEAIRSLVVGLSSFYLKEGVDILPVWLEKSLSYAQFEQRLSDSAFNHFLYESNGCILGYLGIKDNHYLYHLFVDANHQRQGIATRLWQHALQQCPSTHYFLRSSLYAVPVYKSLGFVETEPASERDGIGFQPMELVLDLA